LGLGDLNVIVSVYGKGCMVGYEPEPVPLHTPMRGASTVRSGWIGVAVVAGIVLDIAE